MSDNKETSIATCGCYVLVAIFNVLVGGWSINYILDVFVHKMLPFGWAMVIGLFAGEISVPVAIVIAILKHFGIV